MTSQEHTALQRYFDQLKGKTEITAQDIRDAVAATGTEAITPALLEYILLHAESFYQIDAKTELSDLYAKAEAGKAAAAEREHRANIKSCAVEIEKQAASLAATAETLTTDKLTAALASLDKEAAGLTASGATVSRSRFSTWSEYLYKCKAYDPEKDFTPSMLAGLRFPNGTLSYIGARPSGGKSTLLINLAREALDKGRNVFLVNLEMLNRAIITNFALSLLYATADEQERGELKSIPKPMGRYYSLFRREDENETFDRLRFKSMKKLESLLLENRLFIYDGTGAVLETILRDIESKVNAGDVVLIDYIQRMPPPRESSDQRYIQIKLASNALLTLAIKKNVVIISGAQFGRQAKENKGKEATLEDFREGGDIEQDAHNALAIETVTDKDGNETARYIHVLKQREGGRDFERAALDCNFKYLYIAGNGEYKKSTAVTPPSNGNGQVIRGKKLL